MQSAHTHHHHHAMDHTAPPVMAPRAVPDPSANEVTVNLEARPAAWEIAAGVTVQGWTYNGQVPGPTIEATVGDTLVVRLQNSLPEPTTVHWHGLRLPSSMDGTESVQRAVEPGESYEYRFPLLDAGTFWYHPHSNETVQLERGLYGMLVVREADEPVVDREQVIMLDDVLLDETGDFQSFPDGTYGDGRDGNVLLTNGRSDRELSIAAGQIERWRIANVASSRYIKLSIGGKTFQLIGTDGGLIEAPVAMTEVLLTPGDRADIVVGPFAEGEVLSLDSLSYDRGAGDRDARRFASVRVGPSRPSVARIPAQLRTIDSLAAWDAPASRQTSFGARTTATHGVEFLVNDETHHMGSPVTVGELQVWEVVNNTGMDHPFHLHGFFFQVLSENGACPAFRSWEDTCNVPANGVVRIAWMPDDRPGEWMYHCHILEHHALGMMAHFQVVRPF